MTARLAGVGAALAVATFAVAPASAATPEVTLIPEDGTEFVIDGRRYAGTLTVAGSDSGLALNEFTSVEGYLAGIKEVPFGWPDEALAAQVVAARTYLANTLNSGRSERGSRYGFDICASSACQVYAGTTYLHEPDGDRWRAAVLRTAGEILTLDGAPILAVYSSSAGSRTMAVQDVWGGAPLPYLQPVDSPEEAVSPFASWRVDIPSRAFVDILAAAGYSLGGELLAVEHRIPPEGEGPATVHVITSAGAATVPGTEMKTAMNRWGPQLYPGLLPGVRGDGGRLPQALPSYRYQISYSPAHDIPDAVLGRLPRDDRVLIGTVRFLGEGWGHNLGMSQYGALAMALDGARYEQILAHYYGGITPVEAGSTLPDEVVVGLGWELTTVEFTATGRFQVVTTGAGSGPRGEGTWSVIPDGGALVLFPSVTYPVLPASSPREVGAV